MPDLNIESSVMWRSKPSQLKTWSQRWKRVSWIPHLFTRILKPSRRKSFETELTLLLEAIPVSHSRKRENEKDKMTPDTSGPTSSKSSTQLDLFSVSLKTSKDTSPSDCEKSLATWKQEVIKRRGAYSARVKSATESIKEKGSLSWPTVRVSSANGASEKEIAEGNPKSRLETAVDIIERETWRTPAASEPGVSIDRLQTKEGGPPQSGERLYDKETGRNCQYGLTQQVQIQQKWPTPRVVDTEGGTAKNVEFKDGSFSRVNADGVRFGVKLKDAVEHQAQIQQKWPTVRASEYKDTGPVGSKSYTHMFDRHYLCAKVKETDKPKGCLSPDWVEKMMGVPPGWTALDGTSGEWDGVDEWIDGSWDSGPRIVEQCENRVDRIRLLGNGVVPATAALAYLTLSEELKR